MGCWPLTGHCHGALLPCYLCRTIAMVAWWQGTFGQGNMVAKCLCLATILPLHCTANCRTINMVEWQHGTFGRLPCYLCRTFARKHGGKVPLAPRQLLVTLV